MKTAKREQARNLRRLEGRSVKELAALFDVSASTISLWVRDIELTNDQRDDLRRRSGEGRSRGSRINAARARARHRRAQAAGRRAARKGNVVHAAGCMLYWAEGSRDRHAVRFTNSDPAMVRFFLKFLRQCFAVRDDKVAVSCNLFADHMERQEEIEGFWLATLDLPRSSLRKSTVNAYSIYSRKKRRNKLPYGTCRITVCDTALVQNLYGAIQEYGGFEREAWLA
jgi:hypothetical protein